MNDQPPTAPPIRSTGLVRARCAICGKRRPKKHPSDPWCEKCGAKTTVLDLILMAAKAMAKRPNAEVSDGGPLTHESTETRTRRSLH